MKIKKYIAKSMPEAMTHIRKELGPDAVILNSKEITEGGFFGFFKKKKIEVIAALDEKPLPANQRDMKPNLPLFTKESSEDKVLKEINHLKRMIETQATHSDTQFPVPYDLAYQFLLDQDVELSLAQSLI